MHQETESYDKSVALYWCWSNISLSLNAHRLRILKLSFEIKTNENISQDTLTEVILEEWVFPWNLAQLYKH